MAMMPLRLRQLPPPLPPNPLLPQLRQPHPLRLVPVAPGLKLQLLRLRPRHPLRPRLLLWSTTRMTRANSSPRPLLPPLHRPRNLRLPRRQRRFTLLRQRLMLD